MRIIVTIIRDFSVDVRLTLTTTVVITMIQSKENDVDRYYPQLMSFLVFSFSRHSFFFLVTHISE